MRDFKRDLRRSLNDHFGMSKADTTMHHFVIATVLDSATKGCTQFPDTLRKAAYDHVRELIDATPAPDEVETETDGDEPHQRHSSS